MNIITRDTLANDLQTRFASGLKVSVEPDKAARVANTVFGKSSNAMNPAMFRALDSNVKDISSTNTINISGNYSSGFDVPFVENQSVRQLITSGKFSSNSLPVNWQQFWDAMRIDLTMKKTLHQTIRQEIYQMVSMPNATRIMTLQEMFPYAFEFLDNNGEGQSVPLGEKLLGQKDTMTFYIKATGFVFTLLGQLFDITLDMAKMNDGVAMAYALQRDEDAIKPILDYSYSGTQQTAAYVDAAAKRQELLYNTIVDGIDDLGNRVDPFTNEKIPTSGLVLLGSTYDLNHIQQVMSGLPSTNERVYGQIPQISKMVAYDTEYIQFGNRTRTFTGVTAGKVYLIKPNRYMTIATKRELTMEADAKPDVLTLAREERSWYYCEAIYNAIGIANFIQEITLPTW